MASSYTPTAAGRIIGVHGNTVRQMCSDYAGFLSPGCNPTTGQARVLTGEDVALLQAIREGKRAGIAVETVVATFQRDPTAPYLDVAMVPAAPPMPTVAPTTGDSLDLVVQRLDAIERRASGLLLAVGLLAVIAFALGGLFVLLILRLVG